MAETRRKSDRDFREGAVRLVRETGKPTAQVARDLGINEGTLGNWVNADRREGGDGALTETERQELAWLRRENAELPGCGVLPGAGGVPVLVLQVEGRPAAAAVPGPDGTVDDKANLGEASASCGAGAGEGIWAGTVSRTTLTLAPGRYELICNLPNHYADGMYQELQVTSP